jgi:hypothetical protein
MTRKDPEYANTNYQMPTIPQDQSLRLQARNWDTASRQRRGSFSRRREGRNKVRMFVSKDLFVIERSPNGIISIISLGFLLVMSCSERLLSTSVGNREMGGVPV